MTRPVIQSAKTLLKPNAQFDAEREATFTIDTLDVLEGELPRRPRAFVIEWASLHREELRVNWDRARQGLPLNSIEPLE